MEAVKFLKVYPYKDDTLRKVIINEITINLDISEVFRQKNEPNRTAKETIHQNLSNIILLNYLVNNNYQKYLHLVEENEFGNPQYIKYENRRYSFGILNSILEIGFLDNNTNFNQNLIDLDIIFKNEEIVYRRDLRWNQNNGWALFGLYQSLKMQGKASESEEIYKKWTESWKLSDVDIQASHL